jgi:succinoglycan biosynthesis protein ExoA
MVEEARRFSGHSADGDGQFRDTRLVHAPRIFKGLNALQLARGKELPRPIVFLLHLRKIGPWGRPSRSVRVSRVQNILVIIPTLNEARNIERILSELRDERSDDYLVDFVVVDGGSSDGTADIVRSLAETWPDVTLLDNPQRLQSAAMNIAVAWAEDRYELIVRCDAHAHYPAGFIARLVRSMEANGADAVVVPMDSEGETRFQRAVAWVSDSRIGSGGSAHRGGKVSGFVDHGHHALFRTESFRKAGGYDASFSHNEDAELDCRQRAMGSRIFLDAEIRLRYSPRATISSLARQYFFYGKGRSRTVRRHPESLRARQLAIPLHVVLTLMSLLLTAVDWRFVMWPAFYLLVVAYSSIEIAIKRRSWYGILAAPAVICMHYAWGLGFLWGFATIRERRWAPGIELASMAMRPEPALQPARIHPRP